MEEFTRTTRAALAIVMAAALAGTVATGAGLVLGRLEGWIAGLAGAAGLIAGIAAWFRGVPRGGICERETSPWEVVTGICFALFAFRAFGWIVYSSGEGWYITNANNLGDLSLHLTYIQHLASGAAFWPENPILTGTSLHYPIGVDLLNALLVLGGYPVIAGLVLVGLAFSFAAWAALRQWAGSFGVAGFLFNGGLAGFAVFTEWELIDYQADSPWKNIPLALFVTQRGLLYAIPCGLLLLQSWRARLGGAAGFPFLVELTLYGTLPLFHMHTFIALSFVLAVLFVVSSSLRKHALHLALAALAPAAMLVALVSGFETGGNRIHWSAGWMIDEKTPISAFLRDYGVLPLVVLAALIRIARTGRPGDRAMAFAAAALVLVFNFLMLAPWDWDNIKILAWGYLILLPFLWTAFLSRLTVVLRVPIVVLLFFSGFVSLAGGLAPRHQSYPLAQREEIANAYEATRDLSPDARYLAFPTYNHPLLLTGRKLVMGYDGHLWSHGYDYHAVENKLRHVLEGGHAWRELSLELDAPLLCWSPLEARHFPGSTQPWLETGAISESGDMAIYPMPHAAEEEVHAEEE
jgi:hypothetical protein